VLIAEMPHRPGEFGVAIPPAGQVDSVTLGWRGGDEENGLFADEVAQRLVDAQKILRHVCGVAANR
jgi:hypothetical protein